MIMTKPETFLARMWLEVASDPQVQKIIAEIAAAKKTRCQKDLSDFSDEWQRIREDCLSLCRNVLRIARTKTSAGLPDEFFDYIEAGGPSTKVHADLCGLFGLNQRLFGELWPMDFDSDAEAEACWKVIQRHLPKLMPMDFNWDAEAEARWKVIQRLFSKLGPMDFNWDAETEACQKVISEFESGVYQADADEKFARFLDGIHEGRGRRIKWPHGGNKPRALRNIYIAALMHVLTKIGWPTTGNLEREVKTSAAALVIEALAAERFGEVNVRTIKRIWKIASEQEKRGEIYLGETEKKRRNYAAFDLMTYEK
jgi:hypothetical protein